MSGTADDSADAHAYFRAIEERFVELRGAPLLLSPEDWRVAKEWHEAGVPLSVVLGALEEVFARRAERGATGRVSSLRYCRPAVERAWEAREELVAGARRGGSAAPAADLRDRLRALADGLPADLLDRDRWHARIVGVEGDEVATDAALRDLEAELLDAAEQRLGTADRAEVAAAVEAAMARAGARLDQADRPRLEAQIRRRQVARHLGLPPLTVL